MAKSYKNIIKNLKNYIENNHDYSIENDRFDIDDGQFGKKKCKNISEKEKENVSIKWLQNLDVYYSENTFLNEKVIFLRYESSDDIEKNGGYIILNTENINECFLRCENPIVLLKGNKTLREFNLRNGTLINID